MTERLEDYDYELPPHLVARVPAAVRDSSRLMVLDRASGRVGHARFSSLPGLLREGDLLVLNDSAVRPSRLFARKVPGGGRVEVLLLAPEGARRWRALARGRVRAGTRLSFGARGGEAVVDRGADDSGEIVLAFDADRGGERAMAAAGLAPLPPYLGRGEDEARRRRRTDRRRYQTVYAREPGSVAAPTAGLHFTPRLLARLSRVGVRTAFVTLDVGPGTFRPIREADVSRHRLEPERAQVSPGAAAGVAAARDRGGRVVAVGTTVTRTLESFADGAGTVRPGERPVGLYIRPGHRFAVVDALVTNFHLPRSSLLVLAAAFAGRERLLAAYAEAVRCGYRFYSFGDAMLIDGPGRR